MAGDVQRDRDMLVRKPSARATRLTLA